MRTEPLTYWIILIEGTVFAILYVFVATMNKILGMKYMLSIWLALSAASTGALYWSNNFPLNVALMIAMMTCGNCGSILSAVAADLFPTHFKYTYFKKIKWILFYVLIDDLQRRGMALCFIMMFGRIGAVVGSNFVGAVLEGNCDLIFLTSSIGVFGIRTQKESPFNILI